MCGYNQLQPLVTVAEFALIIIIIFVLDHMGSFMHMGRDPDHK